MTISVLTPGLIQSVLSAAMNVENPPPPLRPPPVIYQPADPVNLWHVWATPSQDGHFLSLERQRKK